MISNIGLKKLMIILTLGIIIFCLGKEIILNLNTKTPKKDNTETFQDYSFTKSQPRPVSQPNINYFPNQGFQPLVFTNTRKYPQLVIGSPLPGSVGFLSCQFIQKYIYPVDIQTFNSDKEIVKALTSNTIQMALIREFELLNYIKSNQDNTIQALTPAYYETLFVLGKSLLPFSALRVIPNSNYQRKITLAYLDRDYDLVNNILSFNNINISIETDKVICVNYSNILDMVNDYTLGNVDIICICCHPKNTVLQEMMLNSKNKLLRIIDTNILQETIDEFKKDTKKNFPWIFFTDTYPIIKMPQIVNSGNLYSTFQVRSLLVCNDKIPLEKDVMPELVSNLVENYQTLQLNVEKWNAIEGGEMLIDNTDKKSYDFDALSTIPKELNIHLNMIKVLKKIKKIVIKS